MNEQTRRRELVKNVADMVATGRMRIADILPYVAEKPMVQRRVLSRLMDAEGHENNRLFGAMAQASGDEDLKKKLKRHAADEARHARMFKQLMDDLGYEHLPADGEGYLDRIARICDWGKDVDLITFLATLVYIEKKALLILETLMASLPEDHVIHRTVQEIHKDELRHIAWVNEYLEQQAAKDPSVQATLDGIAVADEYINVTMQAVGPVGYAHRVRALRDLAKANDWKLDNEIFQGELKSLLRDPNNGDVMLRKLAQVAVENSRAPKFLKKRVARAA